MSGQAQPTNTTDAKVAGSTSDKTITPEVTWAQRSSSTDAERNHIFLTISVPDVSKDKIKLDIKADSLTFSGYSETKKATYSVTLNFYAEIDPAASKTNHTARDVELVLQKKELGEEYWPRLLKDKARYHFLKTDFNKWVDEDEQDAQPEEDDYMSRMGGMGGAGGGMPGMEGMGGMGGMPGMGGGDGGFGGIDFSKLGGAGGPGGMDMSQLAAMQGMQGMGGMGGEGDDGDEDDEDMPELEGEKDAKSGAAKDGSKIQEVE